MKKSKYRILSVVMVVIMVICAVPISVSAASTKALPSLSKNNYIKCYTVKSSGRIDAYTDSNLKTKKKNWYIDCATDECWIVSVKGKAVEVSYPSQAKSGRSTAWFNRSDFTSTDISKKLSATKTDKKITSYRRADGKKEYGYVGKGDEIYKLGTSGKYTQIVYPLSGQNWKMGWVKTSDLEKSDPEEWQLPMKNSYHTWAKSQSNKSWGANSYTEYGRNNSGNRNYHLGIDLMSKSDSNVYAAADGKVADTGFNKANGNYVTIKHTVSGKTVYSFYAHLKSVSIKKNVNVDAGDKIGVVGNTGSAASGSIKHVHFAIVDSLSSGGGYYGYGTKFSGNKTTYSGRTFYNPIYVVDHNKLP